MEQINDQAFRLAEDRLAGELADLEASIELVSTGVATRITLTGLRFGQQLTERFRRQAALRGIQLEASFWPEDTACDVHVSRARGRADADD